MNFGVGVAVLGAVAVETVGRSDSDVVTREFSVDSSGEDQLVVVVVRVRVAIADADVARVLPVLVDARTADPLDSLKVFTIHLDRAIVDTDGGVVFRIVNVLDWLKLGNDGTSLSAVRRLVESSQNTSVIEVDGTDAADVFGTSAEEWRNRVTSVVEQTSFGTERCGVTAGSVAEAEHELVLTMEKSVDVLIVVIRDVDVGVIVGTACGRGNRRGGRRVASNGDSSGDGSRDADQLYDGQQA